MKLSGAAIGDVTIATTNADGSMRSLSAILADCRGAFAGMTEAEKANNAEALVGKNAMSGFLALMNAALGPVLIIIGKTLSAIGTIITWAPKLAGAISAVTDVANTIRSHLHFSVPDEGPLTDFESWMPDFMSGLAEGIEKSRGMVKAAVNSVAADMVVSPQMAVADGGMMTGTGSSGSADLTVGIVAALKDVLGDQKGQQGNLVIPVYLGNQLLDEVIVTAQQRMSLRSGGR